MKKISLTKWILIGLVVGFQIGVFAPGLVPYFRPFQTLFLHGVKCVIAPLIFSTIVTGFASAGNFKQLGTIGLKAFIYFEVVTSLALCVGLIVANLFQPGVGVSLGSLKTQNILSFSTTKISFSGIIEHLLPLNFADAMVRGDVLQIVMFSTLFGFSVLAVGDRAKPMLSFCDSLAEIMFKFIGYVMYLAPFGVCAAISSAVSENGWQVVIPLLKLVGTLYFALAVFIIGVLFPICKFYQIPILAFIKQVKDPILFAFATTSSESAFPMALERLEKFGIPKRIANFVLPLGYSFNLDGSTLYLSLASVFVAQVAGLHLSASQQILIMLSLMLTTKGVAAVPRTSLVVLSGTLTAFDIPIEGIALILGVDTFMDMGRSAINLLGNCLATAVIARTEGIILRKEEKPVESNLSSQELF